MTSIQNQGAQRSDLQYYIMNNLTQNAIKTLLKAQRGMLERLVVEAMNLRDVNKESYIKLQIYDGSQRMTAIIETKEPHLDLKKIGIPYVQETTKYLIAITSHVCHEFKGKKVLEITNFSALDPPNQNRLNIQANNSTVKRQMKREEILLTILQESKKPSKMKEQKVLENKQEQNLQYIEESQLKEYEKISDLYADFQGWQIVVRILESSYKEFQSKNGKLTKIMNLKVIDRAGMRLETSLFGQQAKRFHETIQLGAVYRISKGQVKENSYHMYKDQNLSKYTIILTQNSQIIRIKDLKCIPKGEDTTISLTKLIEEMNFEKQYDIVGILLQIGEGKHIDKEDGRRIYKRSLLVGDPEYKKHIEVILWNHNMNTDQNLLNKVIVLKNFRLNNYRDILSLSSVFKSEIFPKKNHRYAKYENSDLQYQSFSFNRENPKINIEQASICKSIRDLQNEIQFMTTNETIHSQLEFWISFFNFKGKWFYNACNNPKCKKQTQPFAKCQYCGLYNEETSKKFILPLQITDFTGSFWTTAFDDFANEIFAGKTITTLSKLDQNQLKEQSQRRIYQQFKCKFSTKKNQEGIVRHMIIGKPCEINIEKALLNNLQRIKTALY